ncbi:uncharacterized protein EKO05_0006804 [Ascochyta rabiei]|uniref:uncharacterized protein n=1 Tax=Didymella rabiei TaxID=5454 RepID=UPI0019020D59|nr:uncharacterized protein EKO05_0006804 [Ascochyta rabiei]UPX16401.1 hypothetical protein EKO05_0006804 [Ascochyta rabiei]
MDDGRTKAFPRRTNSDEPHPPPDEPSSWEKLARTRPRRLDLDSASPPVTTCTTAGHDLHHRRTPPAPPPNTTCTAPRPQHDAARDGTTQHVTARPQHVSSHDAQLPTPACTHPADQCTRAVAPMMESIRPVLANVRLSAPRRPSRPFYHCLHTSTPRSATPLPHPSVPGPPPETPTPAASDPLDRVARKRRQAEMLQQAKHVRTNASKPTSPLKKRFWTDVSVIDGGGGLQIFLDNRPVRNPNKDILTIPASKPQLATAVALEWDLLVSAQQAMKHHYIPMTSLAARAIDLDTADAKGDDRIRDSIVQLCMRYLSTDTLLCWAPEYVLNDVKQNGKTLRQLQQEVATRIIAHLTTHVWPGVQIKPILEPDSIMPVDQPDLTKDVIRAWVSALPAYELAGLERAVLASKSVLIGTRLVHEWAEAFSDSRKPGTKKTFGIEEAAEAASLEVRWQTKAWGEVEDTHDVEKEDMKRQLGSVILLVGGDSP